MRTLICLSVGLLFAQLAFAEDERLSIRGFGTIGYSQLLGSKGGESYVTEPQPAGSYVPRTTKSYWGVDKSGTFTRDTRFGLNIDAALTEKVRVAAQFFAAGTDQTTGTKEYFQQKLTLLSLRTELVPNLHIAAGVLQVPVWMISEERYIGFTYPFIRSPVEVIAITESGDTMEGASVYYNLNIGDWVLRPRLTYGSYAHQISFLNRSVLETDTRNTFYGLQAEYENILLSVVYGTFHGSAEQDFDFDTTVNGYPTSVSSQNHLSVKGYHGGIGLKAEFSHLFVMGEYNGYRGYISSADGFLRPLMNTPQDALGAYLLLGIPVGKWLPRVTFAKYRRYFHLDDGNVESMANYAADQAGNVPEAQKAAIRQTIRGLGTEFVRDNYQGQLEQSTLNFGLNYQWLTTAIIKAEYEIVTSPDRGNNTAGVYGMTRGGRANLINLAVDFMY